MNKIQKFILGSLITVSCVVLAAALYASGAGLIGGGAVNAVVTVPGTNTTSASWPTNYLTTNVSGVATIYAAWTTNTLTNSTVILLGSDRNAQVLVKVTGTGAVTVSQNNPVTNGYTVANGASITFPNTAGGLAPKVLYAIAVSNISAVYVEPWEFPLGGQ